MSHKADVSLKILKVEKIWKALYAVGYPISYVRHIMYMMGIHTQKLIWLKGDKYE